MVLRSGLLTETGIYLKDWGWLRIEDIVLITDSGCEVITRASKLEL